MTRMTGFLLALGLAATAWLSSPVKAATTCKPPACRRTPSCCIARQCGSWCETHGGGPPCAAATAAAAAARANASFTAEAHGNRTHPRRRKPAPDNGFEDRLVLMPSSMYLLSSSWLSGLAWEGSMPLCQSRVTPRLQPLEESRERGLSNL